MSEEIFRQSRALWNRDRFDLESDEILAQVLERGEMHVWRELYRLAAHDEALRGRITRTIYLVPVPLPHFWLAALASLGEPVDWRRPVPSYADTGT